MTRRRPTARSVLVLVLVGQAGLVATIGCSPEVDETTPARAPTAPAAIAEETDPVAGFRSGPGRELATMHCTGCHSGRLVQQNRATRAGWASILDWMRRKHGFWALPEEVESALLDYLAAAYGPEGDDEAGRRPGLPLALRPPLPGSLPGAGAR